MDEGMAKESRKYNSMIGPTSNDVFYSDQAALVVSEIQTEVGSGLNENNDIGNQFTFDTALDDETDIKDDLTPYLQSIKNFSTENKEGDKPVEIIVSGSSTNSMKYRSAPM